MLSDVERAALDRLEDIHFACSEECRAGAAHCFADLQTWPCDVITALALARRAGAVATPDEQCQVCGAPVDVVEIVDVDEQAFRLCKAHWEIMLGLRAAATPRESGADATYERAAGRAWKETLDTIRATSSDEED